MDAISCLAPQSSLLANSSLGDAALHFSAMSTSSSDYSPLLQLCARADLAYMPPPVTCESVLVSPRRSCPRQQHQLAPNHRAGKRRSRASKRAPTTYITTDPSNFRLMVQHITGAQAQAEHAVSSSLLLPADANTLLPAAVDHHHQQPQQQQPCFPTLDSWNVSCSMYERNDVLL